MYLETDALDHATRVAHEVCNRPPAGFMPHPGKHAGVARNVPVEVGAVFGRIIADLEAGRIQPWQRFPFINSGFDYVPNEPLRWVAAKAGVIWSTLVERE